MKHGEGTLTIGAAIAFEQGVTVNAGRLRVDGLLTGGDISVETGGILGGTGILGSATTIAGHLAPGESPGTLYFLDSLEMASTGTLEIEVDGSEPVSGAGGYDRVSVLGAGNTFTTGGTLELKTRGISGDAGNSYTPTVGQQFEGIVSAQGGILGSFDSLDTSNAELPAGIRWDLVYHDLAIDLAVTPEFYGGLESAGLSGNANESAGAALDAIRPAAGERSDPGSFFPALASLGEDEIADGLNNLSGEIHADALDGVAEGYRLLQSMIEGRLTTPAGLSAGWAQALGRSSDQREAGGIDGYQTLYSGLATGADWGGYGGNRFGFSLGHLSSQVSEDDDDADVASTFAALYGARDLNSFNVSGHLLGSLDFYETRRSVTFGDYATVPQGNANGWGMAGGVALSRTFRSFSPLTFTPIAGLSFGHVEREGFSETEGGSADLEVSRSERSSLRSRLGVKLGYGTADLAAAVTVGWSHEFLDEAATTTAELEGAGFTVQAPPPGRDVLDLGTALDLNVAPSITVGARDGLSVSSAETAHSGFLNSRVTW